MEINLSKQLAIAPASFGMPSCGHAFAPTAGSAAFVARNRRSIVVGDMGLATAYVPRTRAWRPPSS